MAAPGYNYPEVKRFLSTVTFRSFFSLLPVYAFMALTSHAGQTTIELNYELYGASGLGDVITQGTINEADLRELVVDDATTWKTRHGIRIEHAGEKTEIDGAEAGTGALWKVAAEAPTGASVTYDSALVKEGNTSVLCSLIGSSGLESPIDICEGDLNRFVSIQADTLHLWVRTSADVATGALQILISGVRDPSFPETLRSTYELPLPALQANMWFEVFLPIQDRDGNAHKSEVGPARFITLRCLDTAACNDLSVHLDDFWTVNDFIATVRSLSGSTLVLDEPASRAVAHTGVHHDDTLATVRWLEAERTLKGVVHHAPPGTYNISRKHLPIVGSQGPRGERTPSLPLRNDTLMLCADRRSTTFKNIGRPFSGPGVMFRSADAAPANIVVEECGFDWNGWNLKDFATMVMIKPFPGDHKAENIRFLHNEFSDSRLPGRDGCDRSQDACVTRQRHHILVYRVDGLWVEDNAMSGGGRIKAGGSGLGRKMRIRRNTINFVNDNAITIVDTVPGTTKDVRITDNTIINPVSAGIFFGADGQISNNPEIYTENVVVARNRVLGAFGTGIAGMLPGGGARRIQIVENYIEAFRETELPARNFTSGISVSRVNGAKTVAQDVTIVGNEIVASGKHARLANGGVFIGGPLENLTISDNMIRCDDCKNIERGIWLQVGKIGRTTISGNQISNTGLAIDINTAVEKLTIRKNTFEASTTLTVGQIAVTARSTEPVHFDIHNNVIKSGLGHGISVSPSSSASGSIRRNEIVANARDGIAVGSDGETAIRRNLVLENGGIGIHAGPDSKALRIVRNRALANVQFDLADDHLECRTNLWRRNDFETANSDCIE